MQGTQKVEATQQSTQASPNTLDEKSIETLLKAIDDDGPQPPQVVIPAMTMGRAAAANDGSSVSNLMSLWTQPGPSTKSTQPKQEEQTILYPCPKPSCSVVCDSLDEFITREQILH